jgi:hypothetical protein
MLYEPEAFEKNALPNGRRTRLPHATPPACVHLNPSKGAVNSNPGV